MAKITAGIATSHSRVTHKSRNSTFNSWSSVRGWLTNNDPDIVILVCEKFHSNDANRNAATYTIGCRETFRDNAFTEQNRNDSMHSGHKKLAIHISNSCMLDDFDITISKNNALYDHFTVPPFFSSGENKERSPSIIPLVVDLSRYPLPGGDDCWMLGESIARAVESFPGDQSVHVWSVAQIGSTVAGPGAVKARNAFDKQLLSDLFTNPNRLRELDHIDYLRNAGQDGLGRLGWLIMRGALSENAKNLHPISGIGYSDLTPYCIIQTQSPVLA